MGSPGFQPGRHAQQAQYKLHREQEKANNIWPLSRNQNVITAYAKVHYVKHLQAWAAA